MSNFIVKVFLKGFSVVFPVIITVYVLYILVNFVETLAQKILSSLSLNLYFPGLGALLAFSSIFVIGLLMYPWLTRTILSSVENGLRKIPIFKSVYSPIKDMMSIMSGDIGEKLGKPVFVKIPNSEFEALGFVTQDESNNPYTDVKDTILVYIQMSYQIGGFTFLVPKDQVRETTMSVEEGIRWSLTAGLSKSE